jgi:hypothetical protein
MTQPEPTTAGAGAAMEKWVDRAAEHGLRLDELQWLSNSEGIDLRTLLDALAYRVAEQYMSKAWSFALCIRAMNALCGLMRETKLCPDLAFAIFFAFSAGESTRERGAGGLSAEERYTRPMMGKIVHGRVHNAVS